MTSAKAMDGENDRLPDWPGVFISPQHDDPHPLGSQIFGHLDPYSLRRAGQVSKNWRESVSQIYTQRQTLYSTLESSSLNPEGVFAEKKRLFSLILDLTESEPNEVGLAKDYLSSFLNYSSFTLHQKDQGTLHHQLDALLKDLDQPEALIDPEHLQSLIKASSLSRDHFALKRLRNVIEELQSLSQCDLTLCSIVSPLIHHYQLYLDRLLRTNGEESRKHHLEPKVIMSGEGLIHLPDQESLGSLGSFRPWRNEYFQVSSPGISSYRISQQKARALFSLNENGVMTQSNTEGSHYVTKWKGPQRGIVCKSCLGVSAGLPVGMESAMYWFSKALFGRGMAVSSLLTFKGLKVNSKHLEGDFYYDSNYHLIQAADKVEGMTLERFIEKCHQEPSSYNYNQLDLTSFGEQVIISLLTNPTDGKPDNFFVTLDKQNPGKYMIVGIDNDLALKNTFSKRDNKQEKYSREKTQPVCGVNLSNILYCLPLMDEDLSKSTRLIERISNLNEELILLKWLSLLREQEYEYKLLQQTGHLSKKQVKSIQQLNLPLKLRDDVLDFMGETLKTIKRAIKGSSGHLTCWKLFYEVQPLAKKFYHNIFSIMKELGELKGRPLPKRNSELSQKIYEELSSSRVDPEASFNILNQKSFNPIMGAYFCIHHTKTFYLETVLKADMYQRTGEGKLIWESIKDISPDRVGNTKTVDELAQNFFATLDLTKHQNKAPFIELGVTYFKDILQPGMAKRERGQKQDQKHDYGFHPIPHGLHTSWKDPLLLLNLLEEKASEGTIDCLLDWGWDAGVRQPTTNRNALHFGTLHNYPYKTLHKIFLNASTVRGIFQEHDKAHLLHARDYEHQTPLDLAMASHNVEALIALIQLGAEECDLEKTLQFYCQTVLSKKSQAQRPQKQAQAPFGLSTLTPFQKAFLQLIKRHQELQWKIGWKHFCHPVEMFSTTRKNENRGALVLPAWVKEQVMPNNNEFIHYIPDPEKRLGNHLVARAEALSHEDQRKKKEEAKQGTIEKQEAAAPAEAKPKTNYRQPFPLPLMTHHIYFKLYPELPGIEEAVGRLTRMILGFGAPFTELVKIKGAPVMLSQGIQGRNLLDVLKNEPEILNQLDLESVSGLILVAMLTNPEDGKPDNYIVEPHPTKPGKYRLVCVDNDHAFVPAVGREIPEGSEEDQTKRLVVQVKSVLYCLDQMKQEIPASIKKLFLNTNPYTLLKEWLKGLQSLQHHYTQALFEGCHEKGFFTEHDNCYLKVSFPCGGIKDLFQKFLYLRDIFSLSNHKLTHIDLLEKLEYFLAKRYSSVLKENISIYSKFKKTDGSFYIFNTNGSFSTQTKSLQVIESHYIQDKQTLWEWVRGDDTDDPEKAIKALKDIRKKKEVEALGLFFKRVFGQQEIPESELQRQELFSSLDFAKFKGILLPSEQQAFLEHIRHYKLLNTLRFTNCEFLTDDAVTKLEIDQLRELDLRGCQQLTNKTLVFLSETAKNLENLNLGSITNLTEIGQTNFFGTLTKAPLIFSKLKFLTLSNCGQLIRIFIKAPELHNLNVENCSQLTDQMLDGVVDHSSNLQKLKFEGCYLIREWEMREKFPNYTTSYWKNKGAGIKQILESRGSELRLGSDKIDTSPQGLMAFAKALKINMHLFNLTSLDLYGNNIEDEGAKSLANGNLTALTSLSLGQMYLGSNIGLEGAKSLANGNLTALTMLSLYWNKIGPEGAKGLANGNLTGLRKLNLASNNIGFAGAKSLANGSLTALTSLDLYWNNIGDEGAKSLANGNLTALTSLDVQYNDMKDEGAKSLASGNLTYLRKLNLENNNIAYEGKEALRKRYPNADIEF